MVEPARFGPMDAPMLQGMALPPEVRQSLYRDAARSLLAASRGPAADAAARR